MRGSPRRLPHTFSTLVHRTRLPTRAGSTHRGSQRRFGCLNTRGARFSIRFVWTPLPFVLALFRHALVAAFTPNAWTFGLPFSFEFTPFADELAAPVAAHNARFAYAFSRVRYAATSFRVVRYTHTPRTRICVTSYVDGCTLRLRRTRLPAFIAYVCPRVWSFCRGLYLCGLRATRTARLTFLAVGHGRCCTARPFAAHSPFSRLLARLPRGVSWLHLCAARAPVLRTPVSPTSFVWATPTKFSWGWTFRFPFIYRFTVRRVSPLRLRLTCVAAPFAFISRVPRLTRQLCLAGTFTPDDRCRSALSRRLLDAHLASTGRHRVTVRTLHFKLAFDAAFNQHRAAVQVHISSFAPGLMLYKTSLVASNTRIWTSPGRGSHMTNTSRFRLMAFARQSRAHFPHAAPVDALPHIFMFICVPRLRLMRALSCHGARVYTVSFHAAGHAPDLVPFRLIYHATHAHTARGRSFFMAADAVTGRLSTVTLHGCAFSHRVAAYGCTDFLALLPLDVSCHSAPASCACLYYYLLLPRLYTRGHRAFTATLVVCDKTPRLPLPHQTPNAPCVPRSTRICAPNWIILQNWRGSRSLPFFHLFHARSPRRRSAFCLVLYYVYAFSLRRCRCV